MASKGPRSKLDHETRARRQKALDTPREPPRPKSHWDHVLEEMVWLSKDFEAERKWKLAQARRFAIRASKGMLDPATREEKKVKEEEQRLRKIATNISKDVKKFWLKIEKLVLYKHQLELEERKKKALDKQLEFLLGQTERYSTMLAENLIELPLHSQAVPSDPAPTIAANQSKGSENHTSDGDTDSYIRQSDESDDDEHTIEEDEALITEEERREELEALQNETELPLEDLLKRYSPEEASRVTLPSSVADAKVILVTEIDKSKEENFDDVNGSPREILEKQKPNDSIEVEAGLLEKKQRFASNESFLLEEATHDIQISDGRESKVEHCNDKIHLEACESNDRALCVDEMDDNDYIVPAGEDRDDETTLEEEEDLEKAEQKDYLNESKLLEQESEMPIEELLARYKRDADTEGCSSSDSDYASTSSRDKEISPEKTHAESVYELNGFWGPSPGEGDKLHVPKRPSFSPEVKHTGTCDSENMIADAAAAARSAQPTGNTFSTTKVRTKFPFLLKHPLREYQHIGLDWLVTMYEKRLNGILADEMGLGKTIMTIALLAHLACERGIWGPHLIVVPTSVMLNWETEFLKWCPAFKILTYFGTAKERKFKRQGWMKANSFHVCITTYRLVIQDAKAFKRKKWKYLILDEAHLIKNWKSQRWQTLLNFNSKRRILLTGTPLQNDLMELWSLMHFLMPHIFQSHQEFKDWFSNPISVMVEGQEKVNKEVIDRLHNVLRPFILRRLKRDVEKQLPQKHEHVIYCRLSKRQRNLYEDFIASSETQATLASTNFFGMISVIMQLRKVCNHPDLFEGRPIISSFDMLGIHELLPSSVCTILCSDPFSRVDLMGPSFLFTHHDFSMSSWECEELAEIGTRTKLIQDITGGEHLTKIESLRKSSERRKRVLGNNIFEDIQRAIYEERIKQACERAAALAWWNTLRCRKKPLYGTNVRELVSMKHPVYDIHILSERPSCYMDFSSRLADIVMSPIDRLQSMIDLIERFMFAIPAARAPLPICWCSKQGSPIFTDAVYWEKCANSFGPLLLPIRSTIVRRQVYFPDRRLIQFDCGKLQELSILLRRLKSEGHRALIFTQMTKMLDILEAFINLYGYTYMRLDGSTQPEERQTLMQRFNTNPKYFIFILSTRSGGVGINLVGADTVIFYDSDWNPAMDQQAQDRCHRIGQTREVHIYRLVSESTIEENILKKANQKRTLDDLVIQSGGYNMEFFKKVDPMELLSGHDQITFGGNDILANVDVEAALKHVEDEADYMALKKVEEEEAVDNQEFTEEASGKLEDDDLGNDDDTKPDEALFDGKPAPSEVKVDNDAVFDEGDLEEDKALILPSGEDEIDMLADIKQMAAAAAAAGQASSSFENHLRPIDRYAMRFLDLWDPIIDKAAVEAQVSLEEKEWELDRIEKLKEDIEADNDDDDEPLVYESWDTDFATEAYRQQVEALTRQQLIEEQEQEAREAERLEHEKQKLKRKERLGAQKTNSRKKLKKAKSKTLQEEALASDSEVLEKESVTEFMLAHDTLASFGAEGASANKKRKKVSMVEDDTRHKRNEKKIKKCLSSAANSEHQVDGIEELKEFPSSNVISDIEIRPSSKTKMGGKFSIMHTPVKRIMVIKPEKTKKRVNFRSKDFIPSPDSWSSQEDAVLCAVVHEYGALWSLASDVLYSIPAGGSYRGRYRHPIHCLERYRELFFQFISSTVENQTNEKTNPVGSAKALLKVTEEHIVQLLDVACELPDNELLLQKHYTAILTCVWRAKSRQYTWQSRRISQNRHSFGPRGPSLSSTNSAGKSQGMSRGWKLSVSSQSSKLVAFALNDALSTAEDAGNLGPHKPSPVLEPRRGRSPERCDVILEFDMGRVGDGFAWPSAVQVSIFGEQPHVEINESHSSCRATRVPDSRYRAASRVCLEGENMSWASSAFELNELMKSRPTSKSSTAGKQKAASDDVRHLNPRIMEFPSEISVPVVTENTYVGSVQESNRDKLDIEQHLLDLCSEMVPPDLEFLPYDADTDFLSGLEDFGNLPELSVIM